ncbi:MAG: heat-shock protein Hsp20, partial [Propionibacterium sp.]
EANYTDGVLVLSIPVSEAAKPRKINVQHSGKTTEIESD